MLKALFFSLFSFSLFAQGLMTANEAVLMKNEALRSWPKRDVKENLEEAISKFELSFEANPQDLETAEYLMRSYYMLADAHTPDNEGQKRFLEKAKDVGLRGLKTNPEFKKLVDEKDMDVEDAVKVLTEKEAAVAFWTAASLGRWAKSNGIFASIKYKSQILGLLKRVEQLKPDFFHGAVPRYWGSYYAAIPGIAGKDLKKSRKYFEQSIAMAPEYLGTKVLMAEIYAVEAGDKKLFKKLLLEVIADQTAFPGLQPENSVERRKAEKLLEQEEKLF